jgi:hypothetical protein
MTIATQQHDLERRVTSRASVEEYSQKLHVILLTCLLLKFNKRVKIRTQSCTDRRTTMTRPCLLLAACLLLASTAFALEGPEAQLTERAAAAKPIIITGE